MRFDETRPGRDVCHHRYVRADKNGYCTCARMRCMILAKSGPGRIWAHVTGIFNIATRKAIQTYVCRNYFPKDILRDRDPRWPRRQSTCCQAPTRISLLLSQVVCLMSLRFNNCTVYATILWLTIIDNGYCLLQIPKWKEKTVMKWPN